MIRPALAVRARGLAGRLATAADLAVLDAVTDPRELAARLIALGYPGGPTELANIAGLERACRRRAADELATLAHWDGARPGALSAAIEDEDRRSIRVILRGLAAMAPPERRLEGAVATPALDEAALRALAGAASVAEIVRLLRRRLHPLAEALSGPASRERLDLIAAELSLARRWAQRARRAVQASEAGGRYVAQVIDAENAEAALMLAARGEELEAADHFVAGGTRLDAASFAAAARGPLPLARARITAAFTGTPLAAAASADDAAAIEEAALSWQLATQAALRIRLPLGAAPVVWLILRRRLEARRVRRAAWRLALGGPP